MTQVTSWIYYKYIQDNYREIFFFIFLENFNLINANCTVVKYLFYFKISLRENANEACLNQLCHSDYI